MSDRKKREIPDKYRPTYVDDLPTLAAALGGGLSGTSETLTQYERDLAEYFRIQHAVAVSSGAAALSVALAAVGVRPGDEVVLTPTPPLCTVYPIIAAGARPVFADTDRKHFGADPASVKWRCSCRTRAIIETPMWGYATPVDELYALAKAHKVPLILDLAHAHGTTLHGRPLSTYGDLACFSTHERKPLATGEGGFILTEDLELARRCRNYSRFGDLNGRDFGLNYKLGALPAALGRSRLKHLDAQLAARRRNAARLRAQVNHPRVRESTIVKGGAPNYYSFNLRLSFADNRRFIGYLSARGVPSDITRYGCRALYAWPALAAFKQPCPNAEALLAETTTIPVHPGVSDDDVDYIADLINRYHE